MLASLPGSRVYDKCADTDTDLLRLCREGSEWAAATLHHRYEKRVRGLAQQNWPASMRSRFDPDDIVQEVFERFFRAVQRGFYCTSEEAGLWGFFLVVTLNQIRKVAARHLSRRRDVRQTVGQAGLDRCRNALLTDHANVDHSRLVVEELLASLPAIMRQVVERRLDGYTVSEIASDMMISRRATERLLRAVRQRIEVSFDLSSVAVSVTPIRLRQDKDNSTPTNPLPKDSRRIRSA